MRAEHELSLVGPVVCHLLSYWEDFFLLITLQPGREGEFVPVPQGKGAHTTILIIPPSSLDLMGGCMEEMVESGCDRESRS